jgi:hypothetical protein
MSCLTNCYNPIPPRVWSRVQQSCSLNIASPSADVYVPLTNKVVPFQQAEYEKRMIYKGNILQYKINSSNITKKQKYSLIAQGKWTNRTKTWATQSATYTNPNNSSLQRVNYIVVPTPSNIPQPQICPDEEFKEGGSLVCNTVVNPCTGQVIEKTGNENCYLTSDSDVPGPIQPLCWNNKVQTWYPRQMYIMPTSGTKWPVNYKLFVSAINCPK